ncbi:MAG: hypothetical protein FWF57_02260 [Defluviitaleaceae bacterium]|nr:hypothetical protein [Defluviitaleaceae bacterium]
MNKLIKNKKIILVTALFVLFNIIFAYTLNNTIFENLNNEIKILNNEIQLQTARYNVFLSNYENIEYNENLLRTYENIRYISTRTEIYHTLIEISNLMSKNNITENRFEVSKRIGDFDYYNLFISGFGTYENIINYIEDINTKQTLVFIDFVEIMKQNADIYYVSFDIIVPEL